MTFYFKNDKEEVVSTTTSTYNPRTNQQVWQSDEGYIMLEIDAVKFSPVE